MTLDKVINEYKDNVEKMRHSGYEDFRGAIEFQETVIDLLEELRERRSIAHAREEDRIAEARYKWSRENSGRGIGGCVTF